ncbi:succinate dehydrogenase cytochrome b subunit [Sinomicrobium weinanense]|uniref:Succinate dehydrogenase cytochrome b subunit n=1 Tax=Sinomicrobium weinanense TaxID=2842200 RepID=A0A926Q212_9FLAO|nr:succinate dehydrogenase cytochrome b subunit [Sinomicrobium weinanense]MBC9794441.1 succinate dehydrogenase cytochrome b subunit [Sinomicrobium weinanense]MBU3124348.1 succinate dehydrogenase cytochrome b subunit [Sinomicrobium weinanense]
MSGFIKSSIARKVAMALSAIFLLLFLLQHFIINFSSVLSADLFNEFSHFMGTNPLVQFILQPILIFGVVFHFVMGFILEAKNKSARNIKYVQYKGNANSSWMSRNMIYSGIVILAFLGLHFYDFWFPEIAHKYVHFLPEDPNRYFGEMVEKFHDPVRVALYCIAFVLLALHLLHGFSSSFQSVGFNNKYTPAVKKIGKAYAILIPLGFIFIALFHYFNSL